MQVKANGIFLEVEEYGPSDGPPLILIRGLGTTLAHWPMEFVAGFAERGYRTIIFDNRDVGLSERCPQDAISSKAEDILERVTAGEDIIAPYTLSDMALDTIGLMDALGIEKTHIFGISMGGGIAQLLAVDHADRLLSDTIVMTSAGFNNTAILPLLLSYPMTRPEAADALVKEYSEWGSPGYPLDEASIRAHAGRLWDRNHDPEGINRQAIATVTAPPRRDALKSVDLPCFVIHGKDDALVPVDAGKEIGALIPNAEMFLVEGMGHIITPKLAPILLDRVDDFIRRRGL
jgi:pimeloyl-ACP methyl ester carboxylesterase